MQEVLRNYHTHTPRCHHAVGTELEYVQSALKAGFATLGFSDHTPWPYRSGFVSHIRMKLSEFDGYKKAVLDLREQYAGQLEILLGLECEAFPDYTEWLRDFKAAQLDYVLLGNHYDTSDERGGFYFGHATRPDQVIRYGECTVAGMATGVYDCLVHPDLFLHTYPRFDAECRAVSRDLCQAARDLDIPLEFNLLGLSRVEEEFERGWQSYPNPDFWQIAAETGCRAIIGFDAHRPEALEDLELYRQAREALDELGMEVLDRLPC